MINNITILFFLLCFSVLFLYRYFRAGRSSFFYSKNITEDDNSYRNAENVRIFQVFMGFLFFIFHSVSFMGFWNTVAFFGSSFIISLILEIIGTNKGYVFGKYSYNKTLCPGPFIGNVPILIALSWSGLIYMSLSCSLLILRTDITGIFPYSVIILCSSFVTILDVVLDPIAVDEGRWKWDLPGKYYGVPLQNFIGWFFNTTVILLLYNLIAVHDVTAESHSYYVKYAPAFLFIFLPLIAARPCFERNLKSAGVIGVSFTLFLIVASILSPL